MHDLRNDQPLPGSAAASEFGTTGGAIPSGGASPSAAATGPALSTLSVTVYNGTGRSRLAAEAVANLTALGVHATVGESGYSGYSGYLTSTILYPVGKQAQAQALAGEVAGAVLKQSSSVSGLTLVLGQNDPANLTATGSAAGTVSGANPTPGATISAESRTGDQNICSALPTPNAYGGHP